MSDTKEQRSTLILYIGNEEIKGNFKGTPSELEEFINNEGNKDSVLKGEGIQRYGEIISIPISILRSSPYRLHPELDSDLYNKLQMQAIQEYLNKPKFDF